MIEAASRKCSTLVDGTLIITVAVSPTHAQDAFKLFGMPDVPMVIARLNQEAAKLSAQDEMIESDKPKGGELAKLAGIFCNDQRFWVWANNNLNPPNEINLEHDAKFAIYEVCDILSRANLDNSDIAAEKFHRIIRIPFSEYLKNL